MNRVPTSADVLPILDRILKVIVSVFAAQTSRASRGMRDAWIPGMTTTTILTWLVVGLIAGGLAGLIVGGYGLLADIVVGIVGAFIGGYVFQHAGWHAPIAGLGGTIFVAFVGALILLVVLHLLHAGSHRRRSMV